MSDCPCKSGKLLAECCGPILEGAWAETAEALMRSRYTAYATGNIDHVRETTHPSGLLDFDEESARRWSRGATWKGLEIVNTEAGGAADKRGSVEFIARYEQDDGDAEHHEIASFGRGGDGRWLFIDGKLVGGDTYVRPGPKVGRNDPCPCGSGKKLKKCCGKR
jgi:SEC-C motif domain protein